MRSLAIFLVLLMCLTELQAQTVINNNQNQNQNQGPVMIQDQPNTLIEASPLIESRAEQLRRSREDMEKRTEQRIVEKLEEARMEDERARADRLFGPGFGSSGQANMAPVAPQPMPVAPAPVVEVAPPVTPPPAIAAPAPEVVAPPMVEEPIPVQAAPVVAQPEPSSNLSTSITSTESTKLDYTSYVTGLVGFGEYPDVVNVKGSLATGFALEMVTPDRFVAEGSFIYSDYRIDTGEFYVWDLSQYNITGGLKYQILPGRIRPTVGALASYVYRSYGNQLYPQDVNSSAFDVGLSAGLDLMLTETFGVGADFRYFVNVANRVNSDYRSYLLGPQYGTPVEELDYYTFALTGKFAF